MRTRYVQLLSGFVGTSGGFAGLFLPLSKCLVTGMLSLIGLSWEKDIPSPRKTRSVLESRFTRHFDNGKTRPAKPPDVPTNPDRSCTYLVLRAHRISQATSKTSPRVAPWWPRSLPISDQHSKEHWPRGLNKDDPRAPETQGKKA